MARLKENNAQYYSGEQIFEVSAPTTFLKPTFNTKLEFDSANSPYTNFQIYSTNNLTSWNNITSQVSHINGAGTLFFTHNIWLSGTLYIKILLKSRDGGAHGDAYGTAVEENYTDYQHTTVQEIVNNFKIFYVGQGKIINKVNDFDIMFFAKRGIQELSYDVLPVVKKIELTVPNNLTLPFPQDYVGYTNIYAVNDEGMTIPLYPNNITKRPSSALLQDGSGIPVQSQEGENITTNSVTNSRFEGIDPNTIKGVSKDDFDLYNPDRRDLSSSRYGLDGSQANFNGTFIEDKTQGKFSFDSNLAEQIVIIEYVSDGLASRKEERIPKMAEDALYAYILHGIVSVQANVPEYVVRRYAKDKFNKIRTAKLRFMKLKPSEIIQTLRGRNKFIKH